MTGLPTGTVTLLFTDIERSTRLLQELGDRYDQVLVDHHRLLREAWTTHRGHEVNTDGDAFFVAFSGARGALAAAIDAQRALAAHAWPEGATVRVRMGIHTGEPTVAADDYVGIDVHRAARICAAGHGGQILLSRTTAEVLRDDRLGSIALLDLGEIRLKDLVRPEHLFQVVAPGLPADFPPPRGLDAPSNLPVPLTAFVGRAREREEVKALLQRDGVRLVTLTGPGGTGKTRLALEVATEVKDAYVDGVFLVALAPLTGAALVAPTIAQTLGVREVGTRDPLESLEDHLRDRRLLLVLDNFEHVLDSASLVARLLRAAPGVEALSTSRAALRLSGEHEYAVPPLSLGHNGELAESDAVRLFVARARAVRQEFDMSDTNASAIAEICRSLDGLPLAIELAAARTKLLTPQALLSRLRLRLLTSGSSDLPARQRTLRGAIEWSYDLLDGEEQRFFRRLAVFAGGFTLEAAEAVVGASDLDVLDRTASLVDKSLVRPAENGDEEPRYTMLKTIREYATERLEEVSEAEDLRGRHASYYLEVAEKAGPGLIGPEQSRWGRHLALEYDNVRAALVWALERAKVSPKAAQIALRLAGAMGRFWYTRGQPLEGCRWLEAALARDTRSGAERAKALHHLGVLLDQRTEHERARTLFEESLALYRELGDTPRVATSLNSLGVAAVSRGELSRARELLAEALELRRRIGDEKGVASSLSNLGIAAMNEGANAEADALFDESLTIDRRLGDDWGMAVNVSNLSAVALEDNDLAGARAFNDQALELFREVGDQDGLAECLEHSAGLAAAIGDPARAARLAGAAEALRERIGSPLTAADQERLGRHIGAARAALPEDAFAAAWREGREMQQERALAYVLEEPA